MPSKHAAGGCKCCPLTGCPDCDDYERVTVDSQSVVCAACDHSGEFQFRTLGQPVFCLLYQGWIRVDDSNVGGSCDELGYRVGFSLVGNIMPHYISVALEHAGGGSVTVTVTLVESYELQASPFTAHVHSSIYSKTVATCADILGVIPYVGNSGGADICGLDNRVVTLS